MKALRQVSSLLLLGALTALVASADQSGVRTIRGTVIDAQERPLSSAVVYLYNQRTRTVRTHYSERNGRYRFRGLKPYDDYTIHAEHGHTTSSNHNISSSDQKRETVLDLKVDKQREFANMNSKNWGTGEHFSLRPNQDAQHPPAMRRHFFHAWPRFTENSQPSNSSAS